MSQCKQTGCKFTSWRRCLCYTHWRESQGLVFDPELRIFVKSCGIASKPRDQKGLSIDPDV